jgi:sigma-E factor negative regulatory protein RseA
MSEQIREQLSALMDGELARDQLRFLLRRLDAEPDLARTWSRYQLVSSVLRRQGALPRTDIAPAVMRRLRGDAAADRRRGLAVARWLGGGAIAAAVAVFALVATSPQPPEVAPAGGRATAASAAATIRAPAPDLPLPLLLNPELAQPASFETPLYPLPRYDVRYRDEPGAIDPQNALIPYLRVRFPESPAQNALLAPAPATRQ